MRRPRASESLHHSAVHPIECRVKGAAVPAERVSNAAGVWSLSSTASLLTPTHAYVSDIPTKRNYDDPCKLRAVNV